MKTIGLIGNGSGRLGNTVARVVRGKQVFSVYQPKVSNPNSSAQQGVRSRFKLLSQVGSVLRPFYNAPLKRMGADGSAFNAFIKLNYGRPTADSFDALEVSNLDLTGSKVALPTLEGIQPSSGNGFLMRNSTNTAIIFGNATIFNSLIDEITILGGSSPLVTVAFVRDINDNDTSHTVGFELFGVKTLSLKDSLAGQTVFTAPTGITFTDNDLIVYTISWISATDSNTLYEGAQITSTGAGPVFTISRENVIAMSGRKYTKTYFAWGQSI